MGLPLGIIDLIVLIVAVGSSILVGIRFSGKNDSIETYLLGGRSLPWWAILGSIVATETSTATVLSVPGDGYGEVGFRFLQVALGFVLGRILVVFVLLPGYFQGTLMSAYEVLGKRFGSSTKTFSSILFLVTRNLGDGLRLYLAAMVLEQLAGWPLHWSAIVMGGVTILYTYFGGMRSVVWNDCIQFVIYMVGGIAAVFVILSYLPEGWKTFYEFGVANNKFKMWDPQFSLSNANTLWAGLLGGAVLSLGSHGTDQMMVQRYLSAKNQHDAGKAILWSGVIVFGQFALFLFIGMLLHCFYTLQGPLPDIKNDKVFAHFLVNWFPQNTGLIGLMLAAILAAAMSTLSSSLSASASSMIADLWLPNCRVLPKPSVQVWATRLATIAFGLLQIVIGIWASTFDDSVIKNALTIAGFSTGVLLGLFALALYGRRARGLHAWLGATFGLSVMLIVKFVLPLFELQIAYPWLALVGSLSTFAMGVSSSFCILPLPIIDDRKVT